MDLPALRRGLPAHAPALAALALLAVLVPLALAPPAAAQTLGSAPTAPNVLQRPPTLDQPPFGRRLTARQAIAIADRVPKVQRARRQHPGATRQAFLSGIRGWQVSYYSRDGKEIAQVKLDDATGKVAEAWTGFQVAWTMARGYPGAFGRKVNAPYVWLPLCLLFVAPFVNVRRPWRLVHLDLLVLVGFSVSLYFFNRARIGLSVPLVYPFLVYLLGRMLYAACSRRRREREARETLHLSVPVGWLAVALVFLLGFRVGLNVTNSNVIDVGYAGVIGAHRLTHDQPLYGHFPADNEHGDTYGPVNYEAYVPFERLFGWSGSWDDLPAAHAAAVVFDLLAVLLLWLLGRRIRGPTLGIVLAYAWVTFPFTLYVSNSNSNDSLVAVLILAAVAVTAWRPARAGPARGALVAAAALTKFAPLALAPLFATHRDAGDERGIVRGAVLFGVAFAAAATVFVLPALLNGGSLHTMWDRTVAFQSGRGSPFSAWGFYGGLGTAQTVVQVLAVLLALALAFVPRRRDTVQLAALAAAVIIALQLGVTHWFYLYIVWFLPLVLIAIFARYREPAPA